MEFTAKMIADYLQGEVEGNHEVKVNNISRIEEGKPGTLAFLANPKYTKYIYETDASIVLINRGLQLDRPVKTTLVRVDDAYRSFAALLELYNQHRLQKAGIDEKSSVDKSAKLGKDIYLGPFACIDQNAVLGNNVKVYPQVYIGENVEIGENTILYPGVKIYHGCKIGANCIIHAGTIIGSDGFGFAPQDDKNYKKIPQVGNVIIEDNVEIGSNCSIDRATIGSTIIRKGVKLDNLIQVAHNVEIGENTAFAAQVGISGSTKIGKNCQFGGQVGISGHISIADEVKIGAQAGVAGSVKEEGVILLGSPAQKIQNERRAMAIHQKLPDLWRQINRMEKEIEELKKNK
ncbi:MAG: UDP-3-O-(3-hydroxymyristoyl)glucosamine N-acyltransferase [Bacteroidales bacterium]